MANTKSIANTPRGIRVVTRTNADGSQSTRYRVRIERKDFKADKYFDDIEEAKEFLRLSKVKKGKEILYNIEEEQRKRKNYLAKEHITFGDFVDLYIQDYIDTKPKDTELQLKSIGNIKSFYRTIRRTKIPIRNTTLGNIPELMYADENLFPFENFAITKITGLTINDYIKARLTKGLKKSSISREISFISNVFVKVKYYDEELANLANPTRNYDYDLLKGRNTKNRFIVDDDNEEKLISAFKHHNDPQMLPIILISLLTGLRRSEVINLTHEQIKDDHIELPLTKTGSPRIIWLDSEAKAYLKSLPQFTKTNRLFWMGKWSITAFDKKFRRVLKANNLEHIKFHSLRRTNISRLLSKLGAENSIFATEFLGISNINKFKENHTVYHSSNIVDQDKMVKNWHSNLQTTKGYFNFAFNLPATKIDVRNVSIDLKKVVDGDKKKQ